jgi:hypothetical protein
MPRSQHSLRCPGKKRAKLAAHNQRKFAYCSSDFEDKLVIENLEPHTLRTIHFLLFGCATPVLVEKIIFLYFFLVEGLLLKLVANWVMRANRLFLTSNHLLPCSEPYQTAGFKGTQGWDFCWLWFWILYFLHLICLKIKVLKEKVWLSHYPGSETKTLNLHWVCAELCLTYTRYKLTLVPLSLYSV